MEQKEFGSFLDKLRYLKDGEVIMGFLEANEEYLTDVTDEQAYCINRKLSALALKEIAAQYFGFTLDFQAADLLYVDTMIAALCNVSFDNDTLTFQPIKDEKASTKEQVEKARELIIHELHGRKVRENRENPGTVTDADMDDEMYFVLIDLFSAYVGEVFITANGGRWDLGRLKEGAAEIPVVRGEDVFGFQSLVARRFTTSSSLLVDYLIMLGNPPQKVAQTLSAAAQKLKEEQEK